MRPRAFLGAAAPFLLLLTVGCAADQTADSVVLMQQALATTRASLDVVGGAQRPAPEVRYPAFTQPIKLDTLILAWDRVEAPRAWAQK